MGRALLLALGVFLLPGVALLAWAGREVPLVDVHTVPWITHAGRIQQRYPLGQTFRCEAPGLARIDVALVSIGVPMDDGVRLVLREGGPSGAVVREQVVHPGLLEGPGRFVSFELEPIADSAGRLYHFELSPGGAARPSHYSPWIRYRGQVGHNGAWGPHAYLGPIVEGPLRRTLPGGVEPRVEWSDDVPHPWLRAVAFGVTGLAPRVGEVRFELFEHGAGGPPLREVTLHPEDEVRGGFAFFSFEPIEESRWRRYDYRLVLHEGAALVGDGWGPTLKTFHGVDGDVPLLGGMTAGGEPRPDRDLVFRAYTRPDSFRALALAAQRGGWRLGVALLAVLIATTLFLRLALAGFLARAPGS